MCSFHYYVVDPVAQPGFLQGREGPKFFEQHSPDAVEKPSGSSHNRYIEVFSPGDERCVRFLNRR